MAMANLAVGFGVALFIVAAMIIWATNVVTRHISVGLSGTEAP